MTSRCCGRSPKLDWACSPRPPSLTASCSVDTALNASAGPKTYGHTSTRFRSRGRSGIRRSSPSATVPDSGSSRNTERSQGQRPALGPVSTTATNSNLRGSQVSSDNLRHFRRIHWLLQIVDCSQLHGLDVDIHIDEFERTSTGVCRSSFIARSATDRPSNSGPPWLTTTKSKPSESSRRRAAPLEAHGTTSCPWF